MERLSGRSAFVTGAAAGIGAAIAERLSAEGARVAVADVDLDTATEHATAVGRGAKAYHLDVASATSVQSALSAAAADFGVIDVLVNNAGIGVAGDVTVTEDDEFDRVMAVNVRGTFLVMKHGIPFLQAAGGGAVVNVSSIAALIGLPERAVYSASKGAIYALTRAAAIDHIGEGIRINCVAPGTVETPWIDRIVSASPDPAEAKVRMRERQPHGRFVRPAEIAAMVAYLASDEASSVVGACMVVDGGASAR